MSYLAPYLDESGIHLPTYSERMEDLIAGYKRIFGDDVYIQQDSMDYQLLSLIAKCWDDLSAVLLDSYAARNPNYATGTALDMLLPINGLKRKEATNSTVILKLTGEQGTTIELGSQARDAAGRIWSTLSDVTFPSSGVAYAPAVCAESGAIPAEAGTITEINTPLVNWYEVTNESDAVPGQDVESDAQVRRRRSRSVALPSVGTLDGLVASLLELPDVESVGSLENDTNANGVIPAHSFSVVVKGGADQEIAGVIRLKKAPGVSTYGNTTVLLSDSAGRTHEIHFSRPVAVPVRVRMRLRWFGVVNDEVMQSAIPEATRAFVNDLGIGQQLVVSLLYGVVFGAGQTSSPAFSIASLSVTANGRDSADQDTVVASYNELFTLGMNVAVTEVSAMVYEMELS